MTPSLFAPIHSRAVSTLLLSSFSSLVSARDLLLSLLVNLYRPPSQSKSVFIMNSSTSSRPSPLLLATIGSLFVAMRTSLASGSSKTDADLHEALESVGFHQQVASANEGDNVLDILATSNSIPTAGIVISDAGFISDHRMILTPVPAKERRTVNVTRKSRNLSKINCPEFERKLFESELFSSPADNVDGFCEQLASVVTRELDWVAPLKVSSKRKSKPITRWLTPEAIKASERGVDLNVAGRLQGTRTTERSTGSHAEVPTKS